MAQGQEDNRAVLRVLQVGFVPPEAGGRAPGGIASHLWELSRRLRDAGWEVHVLAHEMEGPAGEREGIFVWPLPDRARAAVYPFTTPPTRKLLRVLWHELRFGFTKGIGRAYFTHRFLETLKPSVIHCHITSSFLVGAAKAWGFEGRIVLTVHSVHELTHNPVLPLNYVRKRLRDNLASADRLIFVHSGVARDLQRLGFTWDKPSKVIINPIDPTGFEIIDRTEARRALGLPLHAKIALFAGVMTGRKGEDKVLRAAEALRDVLFIFVGYGPRAEEVKAEARLLRNARFFGPQPREKMPLFYNAADVFVLPSEKEGFALSYMESLLCGTPFVAGPSLPPELEVYGHLKAEQNLAAAITEALERRWDREGIRREGLRFAWSDEKLSEYTSLYL